MYESRKQGAGEFDTMFKEFDRFFDSLSGTGRLLGSRPHSWSPPTDVYATDRCVVVRVEIGGMRKEDFSIVFDKGVLTVSGSRRDPSDKLAYQRLEIAYGDFVTQVHVPWAVDATGIEAEYNLGFLHVKLPKRTIEETRIPVKFIEEAD